MTLSCFLSSCRPRCYEQQWLQHGVVIHTNHGMQKHVLVLFSPPLHCTTYLGARALCPMRPPKEVTLFLVAHEGIISDQKRGPQPRNYPQYYPIRVVQYYPLPAYNRLETTRPLGPQRQGTKPEQSWRIRPSNEQLERRTARVRYGCDSLRRKSADTLCHPPIRQ